MHALLMLKWYGVVLMKNISLKNLYIYDKRYLQPKYCLSVTLQLHVFVSLNNRLGKNNFKIFHRIHQNNWAISILSL